jgi:hypothetical protein
MDDFAEGDPRMGRLSGIRGCYERGLSDMSRYEGQGSDLQTRCRRYFARSTLFAAPMLSYLS